MILLCACGESFESKISGDEIALLCPGCTQIHENGRGDAAPCWIGDSNIRVLFYSNRSTSLLRSVPLRRFS